MHITTTHITNALTSPLARKKVTAFVLCALLSNMVPLVVFAQSGTGSSVSSGVSSSEESSSTSYSISPRRSFTESVSSSVSSTESSEDVSESASSVPSVESSNTSTSSESTSSSDSSPVELQSESSSDTSASEEAVSSSETSSTPSSNTSSATVESSAESTVSSSTGSAVSSSDSSAVSSGTGTTSSAQTSSEESSSSADSVSSVSTSATGSSVSSSNSTGSSVSSTSSSSSELRALEGLAAKQYEGATNLPSHVNPTFVVGKHSEITSVEDLEERLIIELTREEDALLADAIVENHSEGYLITLLPPQSFTPGVYDMRLLLSNVRGANRRLQRVFRETEEDAGDIILLEGSVPLGLLTVNTDRSTYIRGQEARIAVTVLRDNAEPVCNGEVNAVLRGPTGSERIVTTAEGTVRAQEFCSSAKESDTPDYRFSFPLDEVGTYVLTVTADTDDGDRIVRKSITVQPEAALVDIRRAFASRTYPQKLETMTMSITPTKTFIGKVIERVPAGFAIEGIAPSGVQEDGPSGSTDIVWNRSWEAGETYTLEYTVLSTDETPLFTQVGPLRTDAVITSLIEEDIELPEFEVEEEEVVVPASSSSAMSSTGSSVSSTGSSLSSTGSSVSSTSSSENSISANATESATGAVEVPSEEEFADSSSSSQESESSSSVNDESSSAASSEESSAEASSSDEPVSSAEGSAVSTSSEEDVSSSTSSEETEEETVEEAGFFRWLTADITPEPATSSTAFRGAQVAWSMSDTAMNQQDDRLAASLLAQANQENRLAKYTEPRQWELIVTTHEDDGGISAEEVSTQTDIGLTAKGTGDFQPKEQPTFTIIPEGQVEFATLTDTGLVPNSEALLAMLNAYLTPSEMHTGVVRHAVRREITNISEQLVENSIVVNDLMQVLGTSDSRNQRRQPMMDLIERTVLNDPEVQTTITTTLLEDEEIERLLGSLLTSEVRAQLASATVDAATQDDQVEATAELTTDVWYILRGASSTLANALYERIREVVLSNPDISTAITDRSSLYKEDVEAETVEATALQVEVRTADDVLIETDYGFVPNGLELVFAPAEQWAPGTLQVGIALANPLSGTRHTLSESFHWGTIAINTVADQYQTGSSATIGITVINNEGTLLCDNTNLALTVTAPNGQAITYTSEAGEIVTTDSCGVAEEDRNTPDHVIVLPLEASGLYELSLTHTLADNSTVTVADSILVADAPEYTITRKASSALAPGQIGTMEIRVQFGANHEGMVIDAVPAGFEVLRLEPDADEVEEADGSTTLKWEGEWSRGERAVFTYRFRTPATSGRTTVFGPVRIIGPPPIN